MKNKFCNHILLLFLVLQSANIGAQQTFKPILKFKVVNQNKTKLRIIPRDYFEFKAIGNSGLKIEITTLGSKSEVSKDVVPFKRIINFDTFTTEEWKAQKITPNMAMVAQILKATPSSYGTNLTEQIANAKKIQDNTFLMALLSSSFSWDAAVASRTGIELSLSTDSIYLIGISLLRKSPYALDDSAKIYQHFNGQLKSTGTVALPYFSAEGFEKQVQFYWPENEEYLAYHIQSSNLDGTDTKLLTATPYFNQNKDSIHQHWNYTHPLEKNYDIKRYRLLGFDFFGDSLNYSDWIKGYGKDKTAPISVSKLKSKSEGPNHAQIKWSLPLDSDREKIVVYYSQSDEKPVEKIAELKKSDSVFNHEKADNIHPNYYWIFTQDTAGNLGGEFPISVVTFDTIPPPAPEFSICSIDSLGWVRLQWKASTEKDINGYKVGIARNLSDVPITLNNSVILDTNFSELLPPKQLKGQFFYGLRAVDLKGNHGPWSVLKSVTIPDSIAPSFAQIELVAPEQGGILELQIGIPKDPDVASLRIKKITDSKDTSDWMYYLLMDKIVDPSVSRKHQYQYLVQTLDKSGNHSTTTVSAIKSPLPKMLPIDSVQVKTEISKNQKIGIQLNGLPPGIASIRIYHSIGVEPFYEIGKIPRNSIMGSSAKYQSDELPVYTVHQYAFVLEDTDGNRSPMIRTESMYIKGK